MLTAPTLADLALFTGRDDYGVFATQALAQSTLMFATLTKLDDYPADAGSRQLALYAIMQMADRIYLEQPHAAVIANPFNNEVIGSYSYSKGFTTGKGRVELTGLYWWDLAVEELSLVSRSLVQSGSIGVFQHEIHREMTTGEPVIVGPAESNAFPELIGPGTSIEVVPADAWDAPVL